MNRRVSVRLYYGDLYEGVLRKSEMPGFMHLELRVAGSVLHRYLPLNDVMSFRYSVNGTKKVYKVEVVNYPRSRPLREFFNHIYGTVHV